MAITAPPIKARDWMKGTQQLIEIKGRQRHAPYPPNFNNKAARIMEPTTGASTWALGSQRWAEKIGNFTINLSMRVKAIRNWGSLDRLTMNLILKKDAGEKVLLIRSHTRRGKEAVTV